MSIPVRVDPKVRATVVRSGFTLTQDHPMFEQPCPVCDRPLGWYGVSLVYVGREEPGWTAASVGVHDRCTDVEPPTDGPSGKSFGTSEKTGVGPDVEMPIVRTTNGLPDAMVFGKGDLPEPLTDGLPDA